MMEKPTITLRWSRYGRDYHKEVDRSELFKKVKAVFKDPNDQMKTVERLSEAITAADYIKFEDNYGNSSAISWEMTVAGKKHEAVIPLIAYHREILKVLQKEFVSEIIFKWIKNEETQQKAVVREDIENIFLGLFHSFENENEVSKKILKYLPDASELVYNIDTKELFFKDGKKYLDGFIIGEENNIVIGIFDKLAQ